MDLAGRVVVAREVVKSDVANCDWVRQGDCQKALRPWHGPAASRLHHMVTLRERDSRGEGGDEAVE